MQHGVGQKQPLLFVGAARKRLNIFGTRALNLDEGSSAAASKGLHRNFSIRGAGACLLINETNTFSAQTSRAITWHHTTSLPWRYSPLTSVSATQCSPRYKMACSSGSFLQTGKWEMNESDNRSNENEKLP
jgi:hypothetical protein